MPGEPADDVRVSFDVPATMRDGTVLRANVFRPARLDAPAPVLLTRTPYGKDIAGAQPLDPVQTARRGYIVVVQDVRGAFASEGEWFPFVHEADDGEDTVAWAATLDGANGSVGMFGGSYVGFTQMAVAQRRAPALRAIAPMITWDDPDDGVLTRGGVPELGTSANWTLLRGFDQLVKRHQGDARALGAAIYQLASELDRLPTSGYAELPLGSFGPLARMRMLDAFAAGVQEPRDAALFDALRVGGDHTRADLPALHIGGWYDVFLCGTIRNFLSMRERTAPAQYLLIGPWSHGNVAHVQGERDFGMAAWGGLVDLRADLMTIQLQFFDRWLKGDERAFDAVPPVRYFKMGANRWRGAQTWPPEGADTQTWYLHREGRLTSDQPGEDDPDRYTYDPANPAPTIGGATLLHASMRSGPWRQNEVERRDDVLVYTSEPLDTPLEVTGDVRVDLYVATDAPDTDFVARLVDVQPDGAALTITDGIIRMRHRDGVGVVAEPLRADAVYRVTIDLWATSVVFAPGHRVRLDVTSSSFPRWERNLNTGEASATASRMRSARQTIFHDRERPSALLLPVMAREG